VGGGAQSVHQVHARGFPGGNQSRQKSSEDGGRSRESEDRKIDRDGIAGRHRDGIESAEVVDCGLGNIPSAAPVTDSSKASVSNCRIRRARPDLALSAGRRTFRAADWRC
jgi:hypothetical protein